jgi:aldehyde:ferredoxin oxidoreductase
VYGTKNPAFSDDGGMRELSLVLNKEVGADIRKGSSLREFGTSYVPQITNALGILPTRNFQSGIFEGVDHIDGVALNKSFLINHKPCFRCPIACGRLTAVPEGKYSGKGEGPEYETIASIGSACGVDDLAGILKANYRCNELGLDTISAGLTIATAMEMYEKGIINDEQSSQALRFGDIDAVIAMIEKIALREGFGNELAEGSYRLAEKYGHPEMSVTARKQEFPGYDPRGSQGMGLLYATSNKGASHMEGDVAYEEVFGVPVKIDPLSTEGKAELVARFQDAFALIDSAGMCVFFTLRYVFSKDKMVWPIRLTELLNLTTGANYSPTEAMLAAERIFTLERLFLIGAGSGPEFDTLSPRMLKEPLIAGPAAGRVVDLEKMLPDYYQVRGWGVDGIPTSEKLALLGL